MEQHSATAAANIRNSAKWPVIITSVLMAITIGSFGISELIHNQSPADLQLKKWKTSIKAKQLQEIIEQNIFYLSWGDQMRDYLNHMAVTTTILLKDAERRNITVSDKEVFDHINSDKSFADEAGKFSPEKYDDYLLQMYRNLASTTARRAVFEKKTRYDLIQEKLRETITKDIKPTEDEIKTEFHNQFDTVEYNYVSLPIDPKNAPEPTDAEIKEYYDQNVDTNKFKSEKRVKAKYIFFPYEKFKADPLTDAELQNYYDANKAEFVDNTNKNQAEQKYKAFADVKNEIAEKLTKEKTEAKAYEVTDQIHTKMSEIKDEHHEIDLLKAYETEKPAEGQVGETDYFSKSSGAEELTAKAGNVTAFRSQAVDSTTKDTLQRAYLEKGILFYYVNKADVKEEALKPLEECKDVIITDLKNKKAFELVDNRSKELVKQCETEKWDTVIEAQKLTAQSNKTVLKEAVGQHKAITESIVEDKIQKDRVFVVRDTQALNKEFLVVFLKDRAPAGDEIFKKEQGEISNTLETSKKTNAWNEYVAKIPSVAGYEPAEKEPAKE